MEFMQSGPDIIRSETQRWLVDYWASLRGHAALPIWHGLNANAFAVPLENLAVMNVVGGPDNARMRIEYHGSRLAEALAVACVGKFLDEVLPPAYARAAVATYLQVVTSKSPVYTVSDMRDPAGRIVHHERLLLPFSIGGVEVERVLASIEPVSPEGPFELREMMKAPTRAPVIALCATIKY